MGIVVCIAMLIGLGMFLPMPWRAQTQDSVASSIWSGPKHRYARFLLALAGLWNALWYGLQNLGSFWGMAALISGVFMLASAVVLTLPTDLQDKRILSAVYGFLNPLRIPIFVGLLASFLLYLVTLIQLNLGLPIIR